MNYYEQHRAEFLEGLKTFLRIPSISTLSEHKGDVRRAAEFARDELRAAGFASELIEGEGNPLVYGGGGKPVGVGGVGGGGGQADAPVLRALRCAAAGAARRMEVAAVRAGG